MQFWISIVTAIGDLLTLAAAVTDLAAARARARKHRRPRRPGGPAPKAITARYHAHHHTYDAPAGRAARIFSGITDSSPASSGGPMTGGHRGSSHGRLTARRPCAEGDRRGPRGRGGARRGGQAPSAAHFPA